MDTGKNYWVVILGKVTKPQRARLCWFLFTIILVLGMESISACPPGFVVILNECYFITAGDSWVDAQATCRAQGANLATINSAAENSAIAATYTQNLWIGLRRPGPYTQSVSCSQSLYGWVDGSVTTYDNWFPGGPDCYNYNGDFQGCGFTNFLSPGMWDDLGCNTTLPGLCKLPGSMSQATIKPTPTPTLKGSYSEVFYQGQQPSYQCTDWNEFRASLSGSFTSFTVSSSIGGTVSCTDAAAATTLAAALYTSTTASYSCNGVDWYVDYCAGGFELSSTYSCTCASTWAIRPCIGQWGGQGETCTANTQQLGVTFYQGDALTTQIQTTQKSLKQTPRPETACPPGFVVILNQCYFITAGDSWVNAEATCRAQGANLATINSAAENSAISATYPQNLWIGMRRPGPYSQSVSCSQSLYGWVDGSVISYDNWFPGRPDCYNYNGDFQGCGFTNFLEPGMWDDLGCNTTLPGLCKLNGISSYTIKQTVKKTSKPKTACAMNCVRCTTGKECSACAPGYYLHKNKCKACHKGCKTCDSSSNCLTCELGLYLSQGNCASFCPDGTYGQSGVCTACLDECATCKDGDSCVTCNPGFFHSKGKCSACPLGCYFCDSLKSCSSCEPGFFLVHKQCVASSESRDEVLRSIRGGH